MHQVEHVPDASVAFDLGLFVAGEKAVLVLRRQLVHSIQVARIEPKPEQRPRRLGRRVLVFRLDQTRHDGRVGAGKGAGVGSHDVPSRYE